MRWGIATSSHAALCALTAVLVLGCEDRAAVRETGRRIETADRARVEALIQEDLEKHQAGVVKAAQKLAPGFSVTDPAAREKQMRSALRILQQPKKGIDEFVASPMSFLVALDADGVAIARDRAPDPMRGQPFKDRFDVVQTALDGSAATGLGEFFARDSDAPSSWSLLFVAPVIQGDEVVGAVMAGIPLWRLAQRLSRQLKVEQGVEDPVWVYLYKGDRVFHWDTPPQVDALLPDTAARVQGLAESMNGYLGEARLQGEPQVYGVFPMPLLGPDLGTIIVR